VSTTETFGQGRREILRQSSVALDGRLVVLFEVSARAQLEPMESSDASPASRQTNVDLDATLRRWNIPILQGSRWVGSRDGANAPWVIAPVRPRPPAPPPSGRERRSRERLMLELTGLCIGLLDRREGAATAPTPHLDPLRELAALPSVMAHEASNPLTAARAGLQLAMEAIGSWTDVAAERRLELLDELGQVVEDIDRAVTFLRAIQDRARGALARSERFDVVRVVRSCVTLESRVLKDRRIPLELDVAVETVYLQGDPNALYDMLVNLIRNAADATAERVAPVRIGVERTSETLRLTVRDQGRGILAQDLDRIFEPGFTTKEFGRGSGMGLVVVQSVVRNMFGGSITVDSALGVGTTVAVTLPIPPQRGYEETRAPR
jgi:signal transduction histidine kinase